MAPATKRTAKPPRRAPAPVGGRGGRLPDTDNRTPSGRRRVPAGIREGGAEWERLHTQLAVTALEVLAERGYADMGMDEVSMRAGASKRTVYRHYPTKVDLAVAAIRQVPTYAGWAEGSGTIAERLARAISIGADRAPTFVPVLATALGHRTTVPELLEAVRNHVVMPRQAIIAGFIAEGIAAGEIRPDVDTLAVSALLTGIHVQHLDGTRPLAGKAGARIDFEHVWALLRA